MKRFLFVLACIAVTGILSSCGDSATKTNNVIVHGVDRAVTLTEKVGMSIQHDNYDEAKACLDSLAPHIATSIAAIEKLNNQSATEYKQAALDLLNAISAEGIPVYTKAIEFYKWYESTTEDKEGVTDSDVIDAINDFIDKGGVLQTQVKQTQVAFAAKNNMQLQ
jgi:hypothetical protein